MEILELKNINLTRKKAQKQKTFPEWAQQQNNGERYK